MRHIWILLLSSLFLFGCAKNRDVERVRAGDRENVLPKSAFLGTGDARSVWLTKMTVVNTSDSPGGFLFVGFQGDVKIGYFDFTESKLQFRSLSGLQEGNETENIKNPVVLNWNIQHLDYTLDENDGQKTNQEIQDNFKTWSEKKSFRINWGEQVHNETQMFPFSSFGMFSCWSPVSRRRVDHSMKIEEDHIGFNVEVVYQRHPACGSNQQWNQGDFNYTVTYKYSFRKAEPSEYKPKFFTNEQDPARYKYGHFQTVRQVINPANGRPHNIFMENRWAEKTQYFYFVKGFPKQYKWIWDHNLPHSVFGQTNALLKEAGSKLRFEIYDYNYNHDTGERTGPEREFGDLRYSFINFIEQLEAGGTPLGYGPSDTNPLTGEIIAANSMVWTGFLKFYLEIMKNVGDNAQQESSLFKQLKAALNTNDLSSFYTEWDQTRGVGQIFKEMAQQTRYGATFWNGYTSDEAGNILVPSVIDKYNNGSQGEVDPETGFVHSLTEVVSLPVSEVPFDFLTRKLNGRPQLKIKNPYDVLDIEWLERMANSSNEELQGIIHSNGMAQFIKIMKNLNKVTDKTLTGKAQDLKSVAEDYYQHRMQDIHMNQDGHCIMDAEEFAGGVAGYLKAGQINLDDPKQIQDVLNTVLYRVSIHEFGHNLNLRHNFYGSIDKANFHVEKQGAWSNRLKALNEKGQVVSNKPRVQISSSVMDYLRLEDEINTPWAWEDYDVAAILDSYKPDGFNDGGHLFLFCTDEHTITSGLCNRHDFGTTPSQILMSQIRSYDERYELRNKRFGRAYWNTGGYVRSVFGAMMSMKEFMPMWRSAFAEDFMFEKMEEMGITNKHDQAAYLEEFNREMRQVMKLTMAFYQAVLQQSRGDRDYRSEYDETTGALKQIGIVADKIFAMFFLVGDDSIFYNPNRIMLHNSFLTYSREPGLAEFTDQMWRNIVTTRNIAMDPWFINFARFQYAKNATNYYNRGSANLIDDMRIVRVEDAAKLKDLYDIEFDSSQPIMRTTLTKAEGGDYKVGDEVIIVRADSKYYMSAEGNPISYALFLDGLEELTGSGSSDASIQQFTMDVREFYWLYDIAKQGLLQ